MQVHPISNIVRSASGCSTVDEAEARLCRLFGVRPHDWRSVERPNTRVYRVTDAMVQTPLGFHDARVLLMEPRSDAGVQVRHPELSGMEAVCLLGGPGICRQLREATPIRELKAPGEVQALAPYDLYIYGITFVLLLGKPGGM